MINKNKVTCSKEVTSQKWKVATSDAIHRPLFDSICIMQLLCRSNVSNQLFERSLIADALEALNRCQLETQLKFALPSLTNQFTFRCICYIHDLLQRVEDLFRYVSTYSRELISIPYSIIFSSIGSILPTLRHQFAQGAAETATSFMLKYYSTNDQNSRQSQPTEHWLNKHDGIVRRFVLHLYSSNTALRCLIPLDGTFYLIRDQSMTFVYFIYRLSLGVGFLSLGYHGVLRFPNPLSFQDRH